MVTNKSALQVMLRAYEVGQQIWPEYSSPWSRQEFTQPQLFACLAVREMLRLSYRKAEVFLGDVPDWLARIDLEQAPDHNTLWRAFARLLKPSKIRRAMDLLAWEDQDLNHDLSAKPLSIDSTCRAGEASTRGPPPQRSLPAGVPSDETRGREKRSEIAGNLG